MHSIISFLVFFGLIAYSEPEEKPFIIIELFTSEGCSSCPPADRLMSEVVDMEYDNVEVIGLSFHVDYWDYIGWKDPYADRIFTQRQRSYARKFYSSQIYTPQMVVNGKYEFVGSNRSKWNGIFEELSKKEPSYLIVLDDLEIIENEAIIKVSSTDDRQVILNAALVERGLSQNVTRGENRGRQLQHDNVVRSFKTRQFDGQLNTIRLEIPEDMDVSKSSLVLYAQDERKWEVLAALSETLN